MLSLLKADFKIILFLLTFVCGVTIAGRADAETAPVDSVSYSGVITSYRLNIRSAPSRNAGVVLVLEKGQSVDLVQKPGPTGSWLAVTYQGKKGYVRNRPQYIRLIRKEKRDVAAERTKPVPVKRSKEENRRVKTDPAEPAEKKAERTRKSREIKEKIVIQEKMVQTFTQKEREIIEGLNEIDYALNRTRLAASSLSSEIKELETRILGLKFEAVRSNKELELNRDYAGNRLKALYKMNMIGRLDVAGMPASIFDFFLQQNAMRRIIQTDLAVIQEQNQAVDSLKQLEEKLKKERDAKTALESELNDQIRINKSETLKKELILKEIRQKKRLSLAAVDALREAEIRLDSRINMLQSDITRDNRDLSFSNYKGRLKVPVQGEIISVFGPSQSADDKAFTFQNGIDIKVERGEPVKSVFKGEVMFARWLKGYGNLLIINHGDNYYTLYAHVEEIFKKEGESVETGEVIATAGDTGSIKGPRLHFEVRHHGKPLNPMQWLIKGT